MIMNIGMMILGILLAYTLGSINPAYILGKYIKNIDIRKKGNKNAGAINAFQQLGWVSGLVTGLFDVGKGIVVVFLASYLSQGAIGFYLMGVAAIAGHVWPFYLQWKGGMGSAVTIGLIVGLLFYNYPAFVIDFIAVSWVITYFFISKFLVVPYRGKRRIRRKK